MAKQPTEAPADLNTPLSVRNQQKRAARHAEKEAARAPEKRLMNWGDLDARGYRYSICAQLPS